MSIRKQYDSDLEALKTALVEMGQNAAEAVENALEALCTADTAAAQKIVQGDDRINNMERDIEHRCMTLLLRQQPVAGDLRHISTAMNIFSRIWHIDFVNFFCHCLMSCLFQPLIKMLVPALVKITFPANQKQFITAAHAICQFRHTHAKIYDKHLKVRILFHKINKLFPLLSANLPDIFRIFKRQNHRYSGHFIDTVPKILCRQFPTAEF